MLSLLFLTVLIKNPNPNPNPNPLANAQKANDAKLTKYFGEFNAMTECFLPLAFEASGAMHPNVERLIHDLGKQVCDKPPLQANWTTPTYTSYWMQRLSCVLWRETASGMLRIAASASRRCRPGRGVNATTDKL